jgi:hypothetical protein
MAELKDLLGKTMSSVENQDDEALVFTTAEGKRYALHHSQDCCESVYIESIVGDLADLVGEPLLVVEEDSSDEDSSNDGPPPQVCEGCDSYTWTFYKFATRKGYVDVRWFGESNGYYSEQVDFDELP